MPSQEESPLRGLVTSWPALLTLAIALGVVVTRHGLESPRPTNVAPIPQRKLGTAVPSRLWQDPLANVMEAPGTGADLGELEAKCMRQFVNEMPEVGAEDTQKKFLILLAWIEADRTPEAAEMRRRERYATLSALNTAGYVPVKADQLSFMDLPYVYATNSPAPSDRDPFKAENSPQGQVWNPDMKGRCRVPYEWTRHLEDVETLAVSSPAAAVYQSVCVVWVYDDIYSTNSALSFGFLKERLKNAILEKAPKATCDFAITGKIDSDRLADILRDDKSLPNENHFLAGTKLYVTYSTAKHVRDVRLNKPPTNSGLELEYVIGSDDMLMAALVKELKSRHVALKGANIAIIAEWDTLYGRVMPERFHKAAFGAEDNDQHNVRYYSYLRGIDGKLPVKVDGDDKDPGKPARPGKPPEEKKAAANDAEGDAQLDYLRRLVDRMQEEAQGKTYDAIGILGSDVYDKLLLAQALRPSFPSAKFFTTDLDVRMLQAKESPSTRNLIVASHFGLTLEDKIQGKIPPFRSSYDTASYLACLRAVQWATLDKYVDAQHLPGLNGNSMVSVSEPDAALPVHLYEVGRNGAFELTMHDEATDPIGLRNPQRRPWTTKSSLWVLGLLGCFILLGILLFPVSRTWQRFLFEAGRVCNFRRRTSLQFRGIAGAGVLVLLLIGVITVAHSCESQEPWSILEGISAWPGVGLRLFASLLCVYYIAKSLRDLAKRNREVRMTFDLGRSSADAEKPGAVWYRRVGHVCFSAWLWHPKDESLASAWQQFQEHGRNSHRFWRCLVMVVFNALLFRLVWWLCEHSMDTGRGWIAYGLTQITLWLVVLLQFALLAFVIDSTVLCYRFVTYLVRHSSGWSDKILARFAQERGMTLASQLADKDPVRQALEPLLMIRLIAAATQAVAHLIYYPFVVLLVMIVAQSAIFHIGTWNAPLILTVLLSAGAAVLCAIVLQSSAQNARKKGLENLDKISRAGTGDTEFHAKVRHIRAEIDDMDSGVFASFWQNPIFHAVLLPLTGGGFAALQAFLP